MRNNLEDKGGSWDDPSKNRIDSARFFPLFLRNDETATERCPRPNRAKGLHERGEEHLVRAKLDTCSANTTVICDVPSKKFVFRGVHEAYEEFSPLSPPKF